MYYINVCLYYNATNSGDIRLNSFRETYNVIYRRVYFSKRDKSISIPAPAAVHAGRPFTSSAIFYAAHREFITIETKKTNEQTTLQQWYVNFGGPCPRLRVRDRFGPFAVIRLSVYSTCRGRTGRVRNPRGFGSARTPGPDYAGTGLRRKRRKTKNIPRAHGVSDFFFFFYFSFQIRLSVEPISNSLFRRTSRIAALAHVKTVSVGVSRARSLFFLRAYGPFGHGQRDASRGEWSSWVLRIRRKKRRKTRFDPSPLTAPVLLRGTVETKKTV